MLTRRFAVVASLCILLVGWSYAEEIEIIEYGQNAPEMNKELGVTATRGSCSSAPEVCMKTVGQLLASQGTHRFYLNLPIDAEKAVAYSAQYSKLSKSEPRLYEIDLDDFPGTFSNWCRDPKIDCGKLLGEIIHNVKSANPNLRFGLTIYEDQIPSLLSNPQFTPRLRSQVDSIHLYMHKRAGGPNFASYVDQVQEMFSHARIIGGSYPYDRIDFEKCKGDCSAPDVRDLQKRTLRAEVSLVNEGKLAGIEFYPGHFGWEEKWTGWNDPNECAPGRKQQCIDNTKAMHNDAIVILRELKR